MKTLYCCSLAWALLLATTVQADPNRYVWRSFGGANVDLQPLFSWWTFASETTNQLIDLTQVDAGKLADASNLWTRLPARPLPDWFRIMAREDRIAVVGSMWRLDAVINPAPMMVKHQVIYLQNPPVKEIQDFKQARAAYAALQSGQSMDAALVNYYKTNIEAESTAVVQTNPVTGQPAALPVATPATAALQRDSVATVASLTNAQGRSQGRDAQMAELDRYFSVFPDKDVYWVDHFALRTGKQVDGIDVYDMGTAAGLTY